MLTSSNPPVGAIAYGRSGIGSIITALETDRVILRVPDGTLKRVPMSAIARWEMPDPPSKASPTIQKGDHVRYIRLPTVRHFGHTPPPPDTQKHLGNLPGLHDLNVLEVDSPRARIRNSRWHELISHWVLIEDLEVIE